MRKESTHPSLVRLLNNVVSEIPITKKGTYNQQDPTMFVKGQETYLYGGKYFLVEFNDCCWGIEVTISRVHYVYGPLCRNGVVKEIAGFYISRESRFNTKKNHWEGYDKIIYRQKGSKGTIKLLALLFPQCLKMNYRTKEQIAWDWEERFVWMGKKEQNDNIWVDPAGGTHWGNEEDPAAMYR